MNQVTSATVYIIIKVTVNLRQVDRLLGMLQMTSCDSLVGNVPFLSL